MLVTFQQSIESVEILSADQQPPESATKVDWLLPGFVNAHCHLEYSWLADQLPRGPLPFGKWMHAIMQNRSKSESDEEQKTAAMKQAAKALVQGGATTVIDSTTDGRSAEYLADEGLRYFLFHEVLGLTQDRAGPILQVALKRIAKDEETTSQRFLGHGVNPHAPYSVGQWLRGQLRVAPASDFPQAWHLAETADEVLLFHSGSGSIAETLNTFKLPLPFGRTPDCSSFKFLQRESQLKNAVMAFHGNQLSPDEASYFCAPRALVHCPSTHRWFQREKVPLREWLDAGVNICLGTDSLASSDTLSMLEIVRMVATDNPDISADEIVQMAATNPARISLLVRQGISGTIDINNPADLVALTNETNIHLGDVLCSPKTTVLQTWINGLGRIPT